MKNLPAVLCLAVLASACSSSPTLNPTRESVAAYMKKTLNDPASYEAVRWGKEEPITRADSANIVGTVLMGNDESSIRKQGQQLVEKYGNDTAVVIGTTFIHAYRAKNKMGGLVLDSARFVVTKSGQVGVL